MKIGGVILSNDAETCWNAIRYANSALGQKDEVKDVYNIVKESDKVVTF